MITKTQFLKDTYSTLCESKLGKEFFTGDYMQGKNTLQVFVNSKNFAFIIFSCIYMDKHYELRASIGGFPSLTVMTTERGKHDMGEMVDFLYALCSQSKVSFYISIYKYLREYACMGILRALKEARIRVKNYSKR